MEKGKSKSKFIPQYFEIREVGKRIKSTKKQFIWRFNIDGKDHVVELFSSWSSNKKKVVLDGTVKTEVKQKSFQYQLIVDGMAMSIQENSNDSYDLCVKGKFFMELWDQEKREATFNWENKNRKHDPY